MLAGIFLVMAAQSAAGIIYAGVDLLLVHVRLNMYLAGSIGVIVNICFFLFLLFVLFKLIRRMSGRMYWQNKPVLLLLFSAFGMLMLHTVPLFGRLLIARIADPEMIGRFAVARNVTLGIWGILWPFLLAMLLLTLWPAGKMRKV